MADEKIDEIELDLDRDILEGWEDYCSLNVEVLNMARNIGHILPRIDIIKYGEIYRIRFGRRDDFLKVENYGGHSRAIVALNRKEGLECSLYSDHRDDPKLANPQIIYRSIKELRPAKINFDREKLEKLNHNLSFLSWDLREEFMKKYDLVFDEGVLMTRYDYENPPPF